MFGWKVSPLNHCELQNNSLCNISSSIPSFLMVYLLYFKNMLGVSMGAGMYIKCTWNKWNDLTRHQIHQIHQTSSAVLRQIRLKNLLRSTLHPVTLPVSCGPHHSLPLIPTPARISLFSRWTPSDLSGFHDDVWRYPKPDEPGLLRGVRRKERAETAVCV